MAERKPEKCDGILDNSNSEGYYYDPEYVKNTKSENDFFRTKKVKDAFKNKDSKKNK
jgi:hypothetical protein